MQKRYKCDWLVVHNMLTTNDIQNDTMTKIQGTSRIGYVNLKSSTRAGKSSLRTNFEGTVPLDFAQNINGEQIEAENEKFL